MIGQKILENSCYLHVTKGCDEVTMCSLSVSIPKAWVVTVFTGAGGKSPSRVFDSLQPLATATSVITPKL